MFKNVASQKLTLLAIDVSTNSPKTGDAANLTAYVSKDDGAVTVLGDTSATELDATNAPGLYSFDLTQAETNADKLLFTGKSVTANIKLVPLLLYTLPTTGILAPGTLGHTLTLNGSGKVSGVVLTDTITAYTGNTPQTGDNFARIGAAGAGLTALGDTRIANLDAPISSRTKPADTQAAVTLVATTTNLTNLPSIPANWLTATGIASGAFTGAKFASDAFDAVWSVATRSLTTFGTLVADVATAVWGAGTRTLSAFGFTVTVGTNNDKTGYALTAAYDPAKTASQAGDAMTLTSGERTTLAGVFWAVATTALTTAGSIGKRLVDFVTTLVYSAPDNTSIGQTNTRVLLALPNAAPAAAGGLPTLLNAGAPDGMSLAQVVNIAPTGLAAIGENVRDTNNLTPATDSLGEAVNNGIGGGGGGSGDWTANERTAIRSILGIPTSGTTPLVPSVGVMRRIYLKTDLIGTVGATVENDDLEAGEMELVVGDTYSQTLGNEKQFNSPAGYPDPTGRPVTIGVGRLDSDTDLFVETGRIVSWNSGTGVIVAAFPFSATSTGKLSHDVDAGTYGYGWQVEYTTGERTGGIGEVKALRKWGN